MDGKRMKRLWLMRSLTVILGGIAGFLYYFYVGCRTGSCPLTGNPWISTMYGALVGWLVVPARRMDSTTKQNQKGQ